MQSLIFWVTLIFVLPGGASLANDCGPIATGTFVYDATRGETSIPNVTMSMTRNGQDWFYQLDSTIRKGPLSATVTESTRFRLVDGVPRPMTDSFQLNAPLFDQRRTTRFDWATGIAQGNDNGDAFSIELADTAHNRTTQQIWLGIAAAEQTLPDQSRYIDRGKPRSTEVKLSGSEDLITGAGTFRSTRVDLSRGGKLTSIWYSPKIPGIPLRIVKRGGGKKPWQLDLASVDSSECFSDPAP